MRRVEDVLTKTAVGLFAKGDRDEATNKGDPQGQGSRNAESEQNAGYDSTAVRQG